MGAVLRRLREFLSSWALSINLLPWTHTKWGRKWPKAGGPGLIHITSSFHGNAFELLLLFVFSIDEDEYGALVQWNWQGKKRNTLRKFCYNATLSVRNLTWTGSGWNPGFRGGVGAGGEGGGGVDVILSSRKDETEIQGRGWEKERRFFSSLPCFTCSSFGKE